METLETRANPSRRRSEKGKKVKKKREFRESEQREGMHTQVGKEELGDRQTPGYQETRGTTVFLYCLRLKPVIWFWRRMSMDKGCIASSWIPYWE